MGAEMFSREYLTDAHRHSSGVWNEIEASEQCGCFHCESVFAPSEIVEWWDSDDQTPVCPQCGIDSVLGSASGLPVDDEDFLRAMHNRWFEEVVYIEGLTLPPGPFTRLRNWFRR